MVTNYAEWKAAVAAEHKKLVDVDLFLNDDGKERMRVFDILGTLASLSTTPEELLAWIESKEDFDKSEVAAVESDHARLAIKALRNIAKNQEGRAVNSGPAPEVTRAERTSDYDEEEISEADAGPLHGLLSPAPQRAGRVDRQRLQDHTG